MEYISRRRVGTQFKVKKSLFDVVDRQGENDKYDLYCT